jgi:hypothetical protein
MFLIIISINNYTMGIYHGYIPLVCNQMVRKV